MSNLKNNLKKIQSLITECLAEISSDGKRNFQPRETHKQQNIEKNIVIKIINKIKDCPENDKIEKNILGKSSMDGRILLPLYICFKYFPGNKLTTGNIETITDQFGVKIKSSNCAKSIKNELYKYLSSDKVRVKGAKTFYKLNRKGLNYFKSILNATYE